MDERRLSLILSILEENPNPKYRFEQYSITPSAAASTLLVAENDIKNKIVYDLGCGTGRFAIGSALLGAKKAIGVDIDDVALEVARENVELVKEKSGIDVSNICEWLQEDVKKINAKADVVIQFPPFSLDIVFFKKALQIAEKVYSIHKYTESTQSQLKFLCEQEGWKIEMEKKFNYFIPWIEDDKTGREIFLIVVKKVKL